MEDNLDNWDSILNWQTDIPLKHRMDHMRLYLMDIAEATNGKVTKSKLISSKSLLDVGMGRGALGAYLRSVGMKGRLIGVDSQNIKADTAYNQYNRVEIETIQRLVESGALNNEQFEHIICIAPAHASGDSLLLWMINNADRFNLEPHGQIIIASEIDIGVKGRWEKYHGVSGLDNIYLFQK